MNDFKEIFKSSIDSMTTETDIVQSAVRRVKKRSPSKRLTPLISGAIAAAVLCTVTVSAVRYGWLNAIFGDSGDVISENYSEYSLAISGLETESRIPGAEISVNEVICDGQAMYVGLSLSWISPEIAEKYQDMTSIYPILTSADGSFKSTLQHFAMGVTGSGEDSLDLYASISTADGVDLGDRVDFRFFDTEEDMYKPENNYNFRIAFEVAEEPSDMTKVLPVNKIITFDSIKFNSTTKMNVDNIRISPLTFKMTGTLHDETPHADMVGAIADPVTLTFVMTDGSKIPISDISESYGGSGDGDGKIEIDTFFTRVFPVNDLAGIEIGDNYIEVNS